jgi:glycosyltransferase involved in cell wall biosynthesis
MTVSSTDAEPEIVLDLSRLLSRILHHTPTGVDRVELAYARTLERLAGDRLTFALVHPIGGYGRIPRQAAGEFLDRIEALWTGLRGVPTSTLARMADLLATLWRMRPRRVPRGNGWRIFLQSSPHHLHDEALVRAILKRERAHFICLLHDLIPIDFPEYARPGGRALHLRRIRTVARIASVAIANSEATLRSFLPYLQQEGREIPVHVALLGLDENAAIPKRPMDAHPYFVCLATIEPRKNHLLLLNIWRRLAEQRAPSDVPRLVLIGRRGWENEQVIDMLERSPRLIDFVEERNGLTDQEVGGLVSGACALLLPSFAEGYGMPVAEALSLGTPVICSDLPALREAGGPAPDYIDPLDGIAWHDTIIDYTRPASPSRAAQIERMRHWHPPTWNTHMTLVLKAIAELNQ